MLEILRERGLKHERGYVDSLLRAGKRVVRIENRGDEALEETLCAMRDGADAIVQARLEHGRWAGWADVLLRVEGQSRFGPWRYEPVETKLAKETRGATLIQLCLYAELLAELQGVAPESLRVVVPDLDFAPEMYRFDEFRAYFRFVQRRFERDLEAPLAESAATAPPYPEPVPHCDVCDWYGECEKRWVADDSVSLVAGIQRTQRKELATWEVTTLAGLARLPLPLARKPSRGHVATFERLREQARLQLEARSTGRPVYELLPIEAERGLAALPAPSPLDLFLDLEGDRQAEDGGFDYLFGHACDDGAGNPQYERAWAFSPMEERAAFEGLIDLIVERRARDPNMHVYHYAPYEPTALKRLMGRHGTRPDELDGFLRAGVFVDLYAVVRKGLRAGVDSYSIKKLEPLYSLERQIDLRQASRHLVAVQYAIAKKDAASLGSEILAAVEGYNRDDCVSALRLRDWLETLRAEAEQRFGPIERPAPREAEAKEELGARLAHIRAVAEALTEGLPAERNAAEQAQWVLAQLLEWHRREDKVDWWEYFRLNEMTPEDLMDEVAAIAGLTFAARLETTRRGGVVDRYAFPPQDTLVDEGSSLYAPGAEKPSGFGKVEAIDLEHRTLDLRKGPARAESHPNALFKHEHISNEDAVDALVRLGEFVRDHGIDSDGAYRAARDLLLRAPPRLTPGTKLRLPGESPLQSARRVVLKLNNGVLAVQGPPGSGKTYAGARMIIELVRAGKKVGVTAVSHKVIRNLLDEVVRAGAEESMSVPCMHRVREKSTVPDPNICEETDSKKAAARILHGEFDVVGGTAWVWSKEDVAGRIDVLVVDEAGQMSLANVLACSQAAGSLVLLGDPQQLEQPQQASHPEGSEVSALERLLGGHDTIPEELGLFLNETWRLHPSLCAYTSDLFYEGKLRPRPDLGVQSINGATPFAGAGLFYVPFTHEGNQNCSAEEAERVTEIVRNLIAPGITWTDRHGHARPLSLADILIVTPYNAQVSEIAERLPGARVGTVDKFQGQEAPVVIYSMATSSPEEAPHGMEFLFSRHRLNVSTSRARCACILVANPRLLEPECRTAEQMRMANAFCRYIELARQLTG